MLGRELTYHMPFERLVKISRMASRRAFSSSWWLLAAFFLIYVVALGLVIAFSRPLNDWLSVYGVPEIMPVAAVVAGFAIAFWWLRRRGLNQARARADYDSAVRFAQETDGLRFATPEVEYFVRWQGISQMMLIESEGLMFSHGNLFFLVPNEAFRDGQERDDLARDVLPRLTQVSRDRSMTFIPPRLAQAGEEAGT